MALKTIRPLENKGKKLAVSSQLQTSPSADANVPSDVRLRMEGSPAGPQDISFGSG